MENNFSTQPDPQMPVSLWESNPKLKILLMVLIFVFLGSGIALVILAQVGQSYREKIYEDTQKSLPKHVEAQWVTYKDDKFGVEFMYPKAWGLKKDSSGNVSVYPKDLYNPQYEHDYVFSIEPELSTISIFENKPEVFCNEIKDTTLAGLPAKYCYEQGDSGTGYFYRLTETTGTAWKAQNMVSFSVSDAHADLLPTYQKILDSLKISQKPVTDTELKSWKTYKNDEYGFKFDYPGGWVILNEIKGGSTGYNFLVDINPEKPKDEALMGGLLTLALKIDSRNLKEYVNSICYGQCGNDIFSTAKSIKVDGYSGVRLELPAVVKTDGAYWKKDDQIYFARILLDPSYQDIVSEKSKVDIFSKLLSSFKFTK